MNPKQALIQAIAPTRRGLNLSPEQRQAIFSAAAFLEDRNPTPAPNTTPELLEGNWVLLFTTSQDLLGFDRLPGVRLGPIYQCIRIAETRIYNIAELYSLPLLEGLVAVRATFCPETERRLKVTFDRFLIGSQRLLQYRTVDTLIGQLSQPTKLRGIDNTITRTNQQGTLETTYLDEELRIGRGNNNNLFVLQKVRELSF
jgi:hypothetical protein